MGVNMQGFVITLLTCSVTMSVLALFYMAITPLLAKRYSEKGRYYAWLIIVIGLIIPFRPQFNNTIIRVDIPSRAAGPIIQAENNQMGNIQTGNIQTGNIQTENIQNENVMNLDVSDVSTVSPIAIPSISWWQITVVIWLVGMISFLAYHIIKHYCFVKMTGRWSESITEEQTLNLFQSLKTEMGITRNIKLYQCISAVSPMMIGFANPRILLPKSDLSHDEIYFILKHELVHFKRKDLLYKCFILAAAAIHWFNPIVHLAAKAIAAGGELSCDAEVVRNCNEDTRQHYTETIISVIRHQSKINTALSTNFYGGKNGMKRRIYSIMDTGRKKIGIMILCCMLVMTLATGKAFAAKTSAAPDDQTVSQATESTITRLDPVSGKTQYSWDSGKTWTALTDEEYSAMFSSLNIEWWTYDGYKKWMEEQIEALQVMADDGVPDYYDKTGVLRELTQADVEEAVVRYQSILDRIKSGQRVSKTVNESTDTVITSDTGNIMSTTESPALRAITNYAEVQKQTEADTARSYEKYASFGLIYRNGELFYKDEAVRCFDDWYSLGENMQAGRSYLGEGGTVDVYAVRDFSKTVYNPDGSTDPGGKLVGVEAYSQAEFDARTRQRLYALSETISIESLSEGASQSSIITNLTDETADGRTIAEMFEDYVKFGIKFDTKSVNGGLGNIYYNGQLVKKFIDVKPDGGVFTCNSSDGGSISVYTVYDEDGKLIGVEAANE